MAQKEARTDDPGLGLDLSDAELDSLLGNSDPGFFHDLDDNDATRDSHIDLPEPGDPFGGESADLGGLQGEGLDDLSDLIDEPALNGESDDIIDDSEPVALSEDELGNILEDVDESNIQTSEGVSDEDELDNMVLDLVPDETESAETPSDYSDHEDFVDLDQVTAGEAFPDLTDFDPIARTQESSGSAGLMDEEEEEDEDITLTPEELGNIISDVSGDSVEAGGELPDSEEAPDAFAPEDDALPDSFFSDSEEDDEPIALSDAELENILEDVDSSHIPEMDLDDVSGVEVDGSAAEYEHDFPPVSQDIPLMSPEREAIVESSDNNVDKMELRKMISYLDSLFDQLPDDTIREFSKSEYFDLYRKLMKELDL